MSKPTAVVLGLALATPACGDVNALPPRARCATDDGAQAEEVCVATVEGSVVDQFNTPLARLPVTVCGHACYYATTLHDGSFVVDVRANIALNDWVVFVHGSPTHANLLVELRDVLDGRVIFPLPWVLPKLPQSGTVLPEVALTHETVIHEDIALELEPGTTLTLDLEDKHRGMVGRQLRAVRVDSTQLPPFAAHVGATFAFALAPSGAVFSKPVRVRVKDPGLPPMSNVSLFVQRDDFGGELATLGAAELCGQGVVSDDGMWLVSNGAVLRKLNWLVVRAEP